MGAEVLSIHRKGSEKSAIPDIASRGRKSITLDVKTPAGHAVMMRLVAEADGLIEGFRPGVMERLGLGPDDCKAVNKKLVYGRMTGWGQTGSLSHAAGHDINYISLTGALAAIGPADRPMPPLNLVGDFGGGAMFLAMGMCAAFFEAERSGKGQVIDCAMTELKIGPHLLFVAKNIERVGDHVTAIAEQIYFLYHGEMPERDRPKADQSSSVTLS